MRALHFVVFLAAIGTSCDSSRNPPTEVRATIGAEGGTFGITEGQLAGVSLTIQPGVLAEPTEMRLFLDPGDVPLFALGPRIRIEPFLFLPPGACTLHLAYDPSRVEGTSPWNVQIVQPNGAGEFSVPDVNVVDGLGLARCELRLTGPCVIIQRGRVDHPSEYFGTSTANLQFEHGWQAVVRTPRLRQSNLVIWQADWGFGISMVHGDGVAFVTGSESPRHGWHERWDPYLTICTWPDCSMAPQRSTVRRSLSILAPPDLFGEVTLASEAAWSEPLPSATSSGGVFQDVLWLKLTFRRTFFGIAPEEHEIELWLTPGLGPVQIRLDGGEVARLLSFR